MTMAESKPQPLVDRTPALTLLKWQIRCGVLFVIATWFLVDQRAAQSVFAGAMIAIVGQAYFVWRAFRFAGGAAAKHIVQEFYRGEAGKFLLTSFLFAGVFIGFKEVQPVWLFASFVLQQLVAWFVPWLKSSRQPN